MRTYRSTQPVRSRPDRTDWKTVAIRLLINEVPHHGGSLAATCTALGVPLGEVQAELDAAPAGDDTRGAGRTGSVYLEEDHQQT